MTDIERERRQVGKHPALAAPYDDPYAKVTRVEPLQQLADTLGDHFVPPLDVLRERFRVLSYGDMIELATGIGADPAKIWEWANK